MAGWGALSQVSVSGILIIGDNPLFHGRERHAADPCPSTVSESPVVTSGATVGFEEADLFKPLEGVVHVSAFGLLTRPVVELVAYVGAGSKGPLVARPSLGYPYGRGCRRSLGPGAVHCRRGF